MADANPQSMTSGLDPSTLEAVNNANYKMVAEQISFYVGLGMRGAVESANAFSANLVGLSARASKYPLEVDPNEALSNQKNFSDRVSELLAQQGAAIAAIQEYVKGAQTVPPVSAPLPVK